jgi:hypothetical protein
MAINIFICMSKNFNLFITLTLKIHITGILDVKRKFILETTFEHNRKLLT